jgi:hypothetical protein
MDGATRLTLENTIGRGEPGDATPVGRLCERVVGGIEQMTTVAMGVSRRLEAPVVSGASHSELTPSL